jgi:hypothetical protein
MVSWSALLRRLGDGSDYALIGSASANVAAHPEPYFVWRTGVAFGYATDGRQDLPRRAVPALKAVVLDERLLERLKVPVVRHAFDGGYFSVLMHFGQGQARDHAPAVEQDGARAASALIAPFLGTREVETFSEHVED